MAKMRLESVASYQLSRSGLGHPEKPIGSFLFTGPTGVGKTEVYKQLARVLDRTDLRRGRIYGTSYGQSAFGAPPGYVGYDQGGLLTDAIAKNPHAVVLLDEIEKAHPDVSTYFQVMDHGTLTDNNGGRPT